MVTLLHLIFIHSGIYQPTQTSHAGVTLTFIHCSQKVLESIAEALPASLLEMSVLKLPDPLKSKLYRGHGASNL